MSKYRRGARYEREARDELASRGFYVVRSAGSHGCVDLVGFCEGGFTLIQVKSTKDSTPPFKAWAKELKEMSSLPIPDGTTLQLWVWRDRKGFEKYRVLPEDDGVALVSLMHGGCIYLR